MFDADMNFAMIGGSERKRMFDNRLNRVVRMCAIARLGLSLE
jgi:hypothetical protein